MQSNTGLKVTLSDPGVGSAGWVSDMCSSSDFPVNIICAVDVRFP